MPKYKVFYVSQLNATILVGRRSKSEPINDVVEAQKKYDYTPSSLRPRVNSDAAEEPLGKHALQEKSRESNSPKISVDLKGIKNITVCACCICRYTFHLK